MEEDEIIMAFLKSLNKILLPTHGIVHLVSLFFECLWLVKKVRAYGNCLEFPNYTISLNYLVNLQ